MVRVQVATGAAIPAPSRQAAAEASFGPTSSRNVGSLNVRRSPKTHRPECRHSKTRIEVLVDTSQKLQQEPGDSCWSPLSLPIAFDDAASLRLPKPSSIATLPPRLIAVASPTNLNLKEPLTPHLPNNPCFLAYDKDLAKPTTTRDGLLTSGLILARHIPRMR